MKICSICDSTTIYSHNRRKNGNWYIDKETQLYLCGKCYAYKRRKIPEVAERRHNSLNKPSAREHVREHDKRKLRFKGRQILVQSNPRIGVCSKCGKRNGLDIKRTHIHHIQYDENNPLAYTIELCTSCHAKEHGLGKLGHPGYYG